MALAVDELSDEEWRGLLAAGICVNCRSAEVGDFTRCDDCQRYLEKYGSERPWERLGRPPGPTTWQAPKITSAEAQAIDAVEVKLARAEELMTPGETDGVDGLLALLRRPRWMAWAACRGTDIEVFFPERGQDVKRGKAICAGCLVREECLKYALDHGRELLGTWAGTGEQERRRMRQVA